SSVNPSNVNQNVTFTATVIPASGTVAPTGTIVFTIDGNPQSPVALHVVSGSDQATFATSTLSVGQHIISAAYSGDATFSASTVANDLVQNVIQPGTTTTLVSSKNPSNIGDSVTFTATVAPTSGNGTPSGTVTFTIDGTAGTPVSLQLSNGH